MNKLIKLLKAISSKDSFATVVILFGLVLVMIFIYVMRPVEKPDYKFSVEFDRNDD